MQWTLKTKRGNLLFSCLQDFPNDIYLQIRIEIVCAIAVEANWICFLWLQILKYIALQKILKKEKTNYQKLVSAIKWEVKFYAIRTIQRKLLLQLKLKIWILSKPEDTYCFLKNIWNTGLQREREREKKTKN